MLNSINDLALTDEKFTIGADDQEQDGVHEPTANINAVDSGEGEQNHRVHESTASVDLVDSEENGHENGVYKPIYIANAVDSTNEFGESQRTGATELAPKDKEITIETDDHAEYGVHESYARLNSVDSDNAPKEGPAAREAAAAGTDSFQYDRSLLDSDKQIQEQLTNHLSR